MGTTEGCFYCSAPVVEHHMCMDHLHAAAIREDGARTTAAEERERARALAAARRARSRTPAGMQRNRYPGKCLECGRRVARGAGYVYYADGDDDMAEPGTTGWMTVCAACQPTHVRAGNRA